MKGAVAAAGAGKVDAGAETGVDAGAPNMKGATAGAAAGVTASVDTEVDDVGPKEKGRAVEAALVVAGGAPKTNGAVECQWGCSSRLVLVVTRSTVTRLAGSPE